MNQPAHHSQPIPVSYQVTLQRRKTNHVLHLLLTAGTGGLWAIPWAAITASNAKAEPERVVTAVYGSDVGLGIDPRQLGAASEPGPEPWDPAKFDVRQLIGFAIIGLFAGLFATASFGMGDTTVGVVCTAVAVAAFVVPYFVQLNRVKKAGGSGFLR